MQQKPKICAVVPAKRLSEAKGRLYSILDREERQAFCLAMLEDVLIALNLCEKIDQRVVISSDDLILQRAYRLGAEAIREASRGLNSAINQATKWCLDKHVDSMFIVPSDIPLITPKDLDDMISMADKTPVVLLCPSRDGKGTNALLRSPPDIIPPRFGPNSFELHIREAMRRGITVKHFRSSNIGLDIDRIDDLVDFVRKKSDTSSYRFLIRIGIDERIKRAKIFSKDIDSFYSSSANSA